MYHIFDEPESTKLDHLVVNPIWPLFGFMFAGSWLALPWFVFNAYAIGCYNKQKIFVLAGAGFLGSPLIFIVIITFKSLGYLSPDMLRYAGLSVVVWKLGICYYLYVLQSATFEIYEHFGGISRNGLIPVLGGFIGKKFVTDLFDSSLWHIMMG